MSLPPDETHDDETVEVPGEPPALGESFGTWLRQQREMREIHLNEIAERTKISLRYLRAMERDEFDLLPGSIFVKGFLREYAKYVGLNPDEVVNFYLSTQQPEETAAEDVEERTPAGSRWRGGLVLAVLALLLLALLSYGLFSYLGGQREQAAEPPTFGPPVAPPAPERAAPEAETTAPLVVTLDFTEDCRVEVLVDGGAERVDRRFVQGESLTLEAQESVEFQTLGNAGGVSLHVNGIPYPLDAAPGQVRRDVRIDLETLRALGEGELPS